MMQKNWMVPFFFHGYLLRKKKMKMRKRCFKKMLKEAWGETTLQIDLLAGPQAQEGVH